MFEMSFIPHITFGMLNERSTTVTCGSITVLRFILYHLICCWLCSRLYGQLCHICNMFAEVLGVEDLYYTSATHVLYLCVCGGVVFFLATRIYTRTGMFLIIQGLCLEYQNHRLNFYLLTGPVHHFMSKKYYCLLSRHNFRL